MFRRFEKPALTRIAEELEGLEVLHICGDANAIIKDMAKCGYHGISIEEEVGNFKLTVPDCQGTRS